MQKIYEPLNKAKLAWKERNDYKILAFQGAVRSGKSHTANLITLNKLENKSGNVLISGFSADTAKKNVLQELEKTIGIEFTHHNSAKGEYYVIPLKQYKNIKFYTKGGGKAGDDKKIQGMTLLCWLGDETVTYNKDFFDMALTRLSMEESFAIFTMNPDAPTHWLKAWLEKKHMPNFLKNYYFVLDDNPSLPQSYKDQLKTSFSGHFYDRYVLGKWSIGEGLVFSADKLIIKKEEEIKEIFKNKNPFLYDRKIGIDLGTVHPTAFISVYENDGIFYVTDEYYEKNKSPSDLVKDFVVFDKKHNAKTIVYDHAAKWFAKQMQEDTDYALTKANKSVEKGIIFLEMMILTGKLVVSEKCKNLIIEFNSYSYDPKKNNEVIKLNDDALDALRYVLLSFKSSFDSL